MEKERVTEATPQKHGAKVQSYYETTNDFQGKEDKQIKDFEEEYNSLPSSSKQTQPKTQEERFQAFLKRGWFDDLDETITRPNFRFNIMGVDCVPSGEIVAIAGKPSAGKSTALAILIGILIGKTDFAGIRCLTPCHKVLWIDTEKGAFSCKQKMSNFRRVAKVRNRVQLTDIGIYFMRMSDVRTEDRLFFISRLAAMDQYDAVVIDGIFDLTRDADKEFAEITDLLRQLSYTGASVFCMLHTNKAEGDDNMRYALGTELQRLCTTRFTIKFDEKTKCHIIKHDKSNDTALAPEVLFLFDNDGSVVAKSEFRQINVKQILQYVFHDGQSRDWTKLRADFKDKSGVSAGEAFYYCQKAQEDGLITPELDGNMNLNRDYF